MAGTSQPLNSAFALVNPDGTPTEYFIRWAEQRQIDIGDSLTGDQAEEIVADTFAGRSVLTGHGLSGGGDLSANRTIALDAVLDDLNDVDTATTPPVTGQVLGYVDDKWKPVDQTGGGGGGGGSRVPVNLDIPMLPLTAFTQVGVGGTRSLRENAGVAITGIETATVAGAKWVGIRKAAPPAPYRVAMFVQAQAGRQYAGPMLGWSDGTKYHNIAFGFPVQDTTDVNACEIQTWSSSTVRVAATRQKRTANPFFGGGDGSWIGLRDDGTRIYFEISQNGVDFSPVFSILKSAGYLGASGYTQVFFGHYSESSGDTITPDYSSSSVLLWDDNGLARSFSSGGGGSGGSPTTAPTIVQQVHRRTQNVANGTAVLPAAPTVGNLLVLIWSGPGGANRAPPPAAYTLVAGNQHDSVLADGGMDPRGNVQQGTWMAIRRVVAGDTASQNTGSLASDNHNYSLFEITDADVFDMQVTVPKLPTSTTFSVVKRRPPYAALQFLVLEADTNSTVTFNTSAEVAQLSNYAPTGTTSHRAGIAQTFPALATDVTGSFSIAPVTPMAVWYFIAKAN